MENKSLTKEFIRKLEFIEAEGWADQFASTPHDWDSRAIQIDSASVFVMQNFDNHLVNKVIGLGLNEPATEAVIDEILAIYQDSSIRDFAFQICPAAEPPEIKDWLNARGIKPVYNWVKMYRKPELDLIPSSDLRIEEIGPAHAGEFSQIFCEGFGLPEIHRAWIAAWVGNERCHHYLAFDDDVPVATGSLFVEGQVGALLGDTTLKSHRRRGAQSMIMARRIVDARDLGCQWIVTETWEEQESHNSSYHNMLRAGFKLAYRRPNFLSR